MAILALGIVGASLTSAIGIGASVGWLGGVIIGNLLFGQKGPTQEGSRISDLSVQSSAYGAPIPIVYGTMRFAGNVIWSTPLKETRHEQTTHGGKGGGGGSSTQVTYSYSVSFAVGLCVGPVSTIRRIWADTKLIYDATASNTQSVEKYPGVIRFYTGTETQNADPTMEMNIGAGEVPAHRGLVYIVFTDLQLADFANRIPNIGAEVVAAGGLQCNAVIFPSVTGIGRDGGVIDAARGTMIGTTTASTIYKYDLVNNQLMLVAPMTDAAYGFLQGIDSQGYYYHAIDIIHVGMMLVKRHPDTLAIVAQTAPIDLTASGAVRRDKVFCFMSREVYDTDLKLIVDLSAALPSYGSIAAPMCDDPYGNYWQCGNDYIRKYDNGGNVTAWPVSAWTGGIAKPRALFWDDYSGHIYFEMEGTTQRIVKWNVNSGFVAYVDGISIASGFGAQNDFNLPLNGKLWSAGGLTATKTNLVTMQIEETINLLPFNPTTSTHFGGVYEKFTNSMVIISDSGEIKYPLGRYGNDTVALSDVLSDLCQKAGLLNTDIVAGEVSDGLRGYIVSNRMAARDALQPLLGTFFVDGVEIDGVLQFVPRGQSSVVSIPYDSLGAVDSLNSSDAPMRLDETRKQEAELPKRIDLTHVDPDRSYQSNTQHATRIAAVVGAQDLQTIQLSIVLTADEAAQVAERTLKNAWIERNTYSFNLPPSYLRLDPTDVVTVVTPDMSFLVRLNQVDFGGNNILACQAVAEDGYAYISTATGASIPLPAVPIVLNGPVSLFLLDLPMIRLDDDSIGLYYVFGLRNNVANATLYRAPDELAWTIIGTGSEGPTFGWAASILPDCTRPWVWDHTSTVRVAIGQGSLSSASALDVLNWNNVAVLGNEIIQWQTATLISDNLYELSGLLRGRRGTEDATGSHQIGESFVVLATNGLYRTPLPSTEIGHSSYYKGVPAGGDFDDAPSLPFTFQGRSLRCFAPVHVKGSRDGSNNLTLTWFRRTRWYGEWLDNVDAPLFEDSEAYQIDILNGSTVVRTLSASSQTAPYTAAQQTTDFGSPQSSLSVAVYQLNSVIGRGEPARATV